jgi:predicted GIY-YIG superfamily endonuclease
MPTPRESAWVLDPLGNWVGDPFASPTPVPVLSVDGADPHEVTHRVNMRNELLEVEVGAAFDQVLDANWTSVWDEPDDLYKGSAGWASGTGSWEGTRGLTQGPHTRRTSYAGGVPGGSPDWLSKLRRADKGGPGVYILVNNATGEVYVGRSKNVKRRIAEHVRTTFKGQDITPHSFRVAGAKARRGAEQALITAFKSDKMLNKISGISSRNPNRRSYQQAFQRFLSRL